MAALPKRKHSTRRTGKRRAARARTLPMTVICSFCSKKKIPHRLCGHCGK